jgi:hypothetical protein
VGLFQQRQPEQAEVAGVALHCEICKHPGGHPKSSTCGHPKLPHLAEPVTP